MNETRKAIEEARKVRQEIEERMAASLAQLQSEFEERTGLNVRDISVQFLDTSTIGDWGPRRLITRVHLEVKPI